MGGHEARHPADSRVITQHRGIMNQMKRCSWPQTELDIEYHDTEWGVAVHDDRRLFEFLTNQRRRPDAPLPMATTTIWITGRAIMGVTLVDPTPR